MNPYIYHLPEWPFFSWNNEKVLPLLGSLRYLQGRLMGKMQALGFMLRTEAMLETLTLDVLKSSEIEGEILNPEQVRSSIARRLGLDIAGLIPADRNVEGVVEMYIDASQQYENPLTFDRLFGWHAALFPAGRAGIQKIVVGEWRKGTHGPMQVISGPMGNEQVHFEAPDAAVVEKEMQAFIEWFNTESNEDAVVKAAIAHLWFVTIHPFEDGNGRIARAITDMQLARADGTSQRFYSMSAQIRLQRNDYYSILEQTQKGSMDITGWLVWFMECLMRALENTDNILENVLLKAHYWERFSSLSINERQRHMVNRLLDGFTGKLTSSKWAKINKCSSDTALRDIQDLVEKNMLVKEAAGGRSTSYLLNIK